MEPFEERWQQLWQGIGTPAPAGLLDALLAAWREPQRHYHTLQHLEECLDHFDSARTLGEHAAEVELALWFHDAVYDVQAHDNEGARPTGRCALLPAQAWLRPPANAWPPWSWRPPHTRQAHRSTRNC